MEADSRIQSRYPEPDAVVELRVPHAPDAGTVSGYFDNHEKLARAAAGCSGEAPGVYATLNPVTRTLLRVQLEDALKADEMFRILMGEKVEPRREFIQKHALEVKEIDYHGA